MNQFEYDVPIIICEPEEIYLNETKELLEKQGFKNLILYSDTKDLLDYMGTSEECAGSVLILGLSTSYSVPSIETTKIIKQECPNIMIIGSYLGKKSNFSLSLMALSNGVDSWVERQKSNYTEDIIKKVNHWTSYVKENYKLIKLCNF